jgi:cob(I)alamin adenosyltransferase
MVYLSRIYTKTGDDGTTSLGDGGRVSKDSARVEAYGTVDELHGVIGVLLASAPEIPERPLLLDICNDLFDVGGDLCVPIREDEQTGAALRIAESQVQRLEQAIDRLNANLSPLRSFILRGGTPAAAWCHLACTVCRRAERRVVTLAAKEAVNPNVVVYLNRLSDLLFVLARSLNDGGKGDVLWVPGKGRNE